MGKNNTKQEKAKRNLEYAQKYKKRRPSASRGGRPSPRPAAPAGAPGGFAPMGQGGAPRVMHDAICASCASPTQVPFEPTSGKPVLCRTCFTAQRA